jgi:hypothetical protein
MVLASPGPLLTPPPSSSPPKTPHWSYSGQTRSQDEDKNLPPKPYLPPQTRTRHRLAHRPHVTTMIQGNTPPTTCSPSHQSHLTGNPPNLQPVTVGEEERDGRDPTSRWMLMRAAPDCRPPQTTWHASQPRSSSTSHPPQQQDAVHRELRPGTGKGARASAGQLRHDTRQAAGPARALPGPRPGPARPAAAAPHNTSPVNKNRPEEMRTSCRQQQAPPQRDAAKMSPHISICPEPVLAAHAPSPSASGSHCPAREGSALH